MTDPVSGRAERVTYMLLMLSSAAASLAKIFVFAAVLGAEDFAYYSFLDLIAAYGLYAGSLGLVEGASRLVPFLTGKAQASRAGAVAARASGGVLTLSTALFVLLAPLAILLPQDSELSLALIAGGCFAVANNLFLLGSMLPLALGKPAVFAALLFAKNVATLVLGAVLGSIWGFVGALAAEIVVTTLLACWSLWPGRFQPAIRPWKLRPLRGIFRGGMPLMLGALAQNVTRNLDRIVAGAALGLTLFGQYSFAMALSMGGLVALNLLTQYATPKITRAYGAGVELGGLLRRLDVIVAGLLAAAMATYPAFLYVADRLAVPLFPDFVAGIDLMKIVYFGAALQVLQIYQAFLVARGEGWRLTRQSLFVGLVASAGCAHGYLTGQDAHYFAYVFVLHRFASGATMRWLAGSPSAGRTSRIG